jgi:hypothetical protein
METTLARGQNTPVLLGFQGASLDSHGESVAFQRTFSGISS